MKTTTYLFLMAVCLLSVQWALAQPANDDCANAFLITEPVNWCSSEGQFTTSEATGDATFTPSCYEATSDIWFTFTAIAPSLSVSVLGGFLSNQLSQPQVTLYTGTCEGLSEVTCQAGTGLSLQVIENELELGQTYYLQVQGLTVGNLSLCINNYSGEIGAVSDCPDAAILCNQDPFVIPQVLSGGNDPSEADDAGCLNIAGLPVETFSTWFVWTAAEDGSLTFSLTPINATDDLDFVLYEFPNGPGDCSGKTVLRCMASSCFGPTGLNESALDISEPPGCGPGQDNFLSEIQMEAGVTYGLMVNNFSQTTIGFEVAFGGTGSFFGGEERLAAEAQEVCQDSLLSFTGLNPPGSATVVDWQWAFGSGATPAFAAGPGPHEVAFSSAGTQFVLLRATTEQGCTSTEILPIEVLCCADHFSIVPTIARPSCAGEADGSIALQLESPYGPPFFITWEDGTDSNPKEELAAGLYSVTISDTSECHTVRIFEIPQAQPFEMDTLLNLPSCDAGMDGSITLHVSGSAPPFMFAWNGLPFSSVNTLDNLTAGLYTVAIQDSQGCTDTLEIDLQELELVLDPQVTSITAPSCFDFPDGQIAIAIANGLPPYQFDFNDGNGYVASSALSELSAGTYTIAVLDANLCEGQFVIELEAPLPLEANLQPTTISCYGAADGELIPTPSGGTPPYSFEWEDNSSIAERTDLPPGTYALTVTDVNGCLANTAYEMAVPAPVEADVDSLAGPLCFGDLNGFLAVSATGGQPPFTYQIDGLPLQSDPVFTSLAAGSYVITISDSRNCTTSISGSLPAPEALSLAIQAPPPIVLGDSGQLTVITNAVDPVYDWAPPVFLSCTDCASPEVVQPTASTYYTLSVTDEAGCRTTDSVFSEVFLTYPAYLPNAFSPNDDGINDTWQPYGGPALERWLQLLVFDRWGGLIFEAQNPNSQNAVLEWDGRAENQPVPIGVYTCIIDGQFIDGTVRQFQTDLLLTR
ncbi:MAG: gliding motility-associated C-terminal domain-containing protein [Phaeodactylibacter sp.]|uniref:T9SS type B sorting domain-containing protein n=1 Tax=Phaeodactylibacter sp. TaxID=1940289 RepID=UPI0032ED7B5B